MGITIDEAIESLENMKALVGANHFALKMGIDTMRKYQKIEQILNDWKEMGYSENDGLYSLISEVVEDGKID